MTSRFYKLYQENFPEKEILIYEGNLDRHFHGLDLVIFDHARAIDEQGVRAYVGLVDTVLLIDHPRAKMAKGGAVAAEAAGYLYSETLQRGVTVYSNDKNAVEVLSGRQTVAREDDPEIEEITDTCVETTSETTLPPTPGFGMTIAGEEATIFPPEDWLECDDQEDDWK